MKRKSVTKASVPKKSVTQSYEKTSRTKTFRRAAGVMSRKHKLSY